MPTYNSIVDYVGDGVTTRWVFAFSGGFISPDHVFTEIDGITAPAILDGTSTVVIEPPLALDARVRILRRTPRNAPLANFSDGAGITDTNLDIIASQSLFVSAEQFDNADDIAARSIVFPAGETATPLPAAADRLGKVAFFDGATGSLVVATPAELGILAAASSAAFAANSQADRSRGNHSGTQAISTVLGLAAALDTKVTSDTLASSVGAQGTGFLPPGVDAVLRPVSDKLADLCSVKDFGATGDGTTNDYAAIVLARNEAIGSGKVLFFPSGTYAFGTTLALGFANLHVQFGKVVLKPTHAGVGISFDAGAAPAGVFGIQFGWGNPPTVQGNALTTDAVYVRACHHAKIDIRIRDCVTGMRVNFAVLSEFKINHSSNQGGWPALAPTNGLIIDRREEPEATTACRFDLCIEGMSGMGVVLACAQHCDFWGTSEGNGAGGLDLAVISGNNNFHNFFCEQNGTAPHWTIASHNNIFFNCAGGGPSNTGLNTNIISGVRNLFIRGKWHNATVIGYYNDFDQVALSGTYAHNPQDIRHKCHDGAGNEIEDMIVLPLTLEGLWVEQTVAGQTAPAYYRDHFGIVHLTGAVKTGAAGSTIATLPAGYRPGGGQWVPYFSPTAGTVGGLAVGASGGIQHISGDNGTVSLDGISFLAEG